MYINEKKPSVINTGSLKIQIILFSDKIQHITDHLKFYKKDLNSQKSLLKLVEKRRKLLKYIKNNNFKLYNNINNRIIIP